jgi:protein-tyrosine phosphatase
MLLDATQIYGGLYQGSKPPMGHVLQDAGFAAVVLCAAEYQPPDGAFPGIKVHRVPFDDQSNRDLNREDLAPIIKAARFTVGVLKRNKKVLVTCWMGLNRSGLVSALSLHMLLGISGEKAAWIVQAKRPNALRNPMFMAHLNRVQGDPLTDTFF